MSIPRRARETNLCWNVCVPACVCACALCIASIMAFKAALALWNHMSSEGGDGWNRGRDADDTNRPWHFIRLLDIQSGEWWQIVQKKRLPAALLKSLDKGKKKKNPTKDGWVTGACGAQKCTYARAGDQILQETDTDALLATFNIKRRLNSTTRADALSLSSTSCLCVPWLRPYLNAPWVTAAGGSCWKGRQALHVDVNVLFAQKLYVLIR